MLIELRLLRLIGAWKVKVRTPTVVVEGLDLGIDAAAEHARCAISGRATLESSYQGQID